MAFNIDADPINANWVRWKNWDVQVSNLSELLIFLGVENQPFAIQRRQVERLSRYIGQAPEQLQLEFADFLRDTPHTL